MNIWHCSIEKELGSLSYDWNYKLELKLFWISVHPHTSYRTILWYCVNMEGTIYLFVFEQNKKKLLISKLKSHFRLQLILFNILLPKHLSASLPINTFYLCFLSLFSAKSESVITNNWICCRLCVLTYLQSIVQIFKLTIYLLHIRTLFNKWSSLLFCSR